MLDSNSKGSSIAQMRIKFVHENIDRFTHVELAAKLGISVSSIRKYVRKLKKENMIPNEHTGRIRTASVRNSFNLTGDNSVDVVRTMDTFNIGRVTARKLVHKMTGKKLYDNEATRGRRIKVASLHNVGLSVVDIAKRLAVTHAMVRTDLIVLGKLSPTNADDLGERIHGLIMQGYSIKVASAECSVSVSKGWMAHKALRLEKPSIEEEFRELYSISDAGTATTRRKKRMTAIDLKVSNLIDQHTLAEIVDQLKLSEKLIKASIKKLLYHNVAVYDSEKQVYRAIESAVIESFTDNSENNGIRKSCLRLGISISRYRSIIRRQLLAGEINIKEIFGKFDRDSSIIKLNEVCGAETIAIVMGVNASTVRRIIRSRKDKYISLKGASNGKK